MTTCFRNEMLRLLLMDCTRRRISTLLCMKRDIATQTYQQVPPKNEDQFRRRDNPNLTTHQSKTSLHSRKDSNRNRAAYKPQYTTFGREDFECDKDLNLLMAQEVEHTNILQSLLYYTDLERYPSRKTLQVLCSRFASKGDINAVKHIQKISNKAYSKECAYMLNYDYYLAEALWKRGNHDEATNIFVRLFKDAPLRRRKIMNMANFMIKDIFLNKRESAYESALVFVQCCAETTGDYTAAANLWRWSFLSKDLKAINLAENYLQEHPPAKNSVSRKINALIKAAYEESNIDILQRLSQAIAKYKLTDDNYLLFSMLLRYQCGLEDLRGAMETFTYCMSEKIPLPPTDIRNLVALHHLHKKQIPDILLNLKYKHTSTEKPEFSW